MARTVIGHVRSVLRRTYVFLMNKFLDAVVCLVIPINTVFAICVWLELFWLPLGQQIGFVSLQKVREVNLLIMYWIVAPYTILVVVLLLLVSFRSRLPSLWSGSESKENHMP